MASFEERVRAAMPQVDVTSFGAKGNGVHDDTEAIQAAADELSLFEGGKIFLPKGQYKITGPINIGLYFVIVEGEGQMSAITNAGTTSNMIFQNCERVSIMNMSFTGNGGALGAGATNLHGLEFINTHNVRLYNVTCLYNGGHGVYCHGGAWCHSYIGCYFSQNKLDGVHSVTNTYGEQNGNNFSIVNTTILQNGGNGLSWKAFSLNVVGSDIELNAGFGIKIGDTATDTSVYAVNITGNYLEGNLQGEIRLQTGTTQGIYGVKVDGNFIYSNNSGSYACISCAGAYGSIDALEIGISNTYFLGGTSVNHFDFGNATTKSCKVYIKDRYQPMVNLGQATVVYPYRTVILDGLTEQKAFPWDNAFASNNILAIPTKTTVFKVPAHEGDQLQRIAFSIKSDCTDLYTVTTTVRFDTPLQPVGEATVVYHLGTATLGGNHVTDIFVPSIVAYRLPPETVGYLYIQISNPSTGTYMTLSDVIIEM